MIRVRTRVMNLISNLYLGNQTPYTTPESHIQTEMTLPINVSGPRPHNEFIIQPQPKQSDPLQYNPNATNKLKCPPFNNMINLKSNGSMDSST